MTSGPRYRDTTDAEWIILDLLLEHGKTTRGIGELVDVIGSPILVAEALESLQATGLIECTDVFVRVTQP